MKHRIHFIAAALVMPLAACGGTDPADMPGNGAAAVNEAAVANTAAANTNAAEPDMAYQISDDPNIVTPAGLGTIGIGMAPAVAGADMLKEDGVQLSESCRTLKSDQYPRVYVISDGSNVKRITIMDRSEVQTAKGVSVGATEAEVRRAYPDLREEGHQYVGPPAKNLYYEPRGKDEPALRFEIDGDGMVSHIHAGMQPELSYSEGCA